MFKKYVFAWKDGDAERSVDFFVHSRKTRNGFQHRACCIGPLPRLDDEYNDWPAYRANEDKLFKKRVAKVNYLNRSWEAWGGQTCLSRLWEQLAKLSFLDMSEVAKVNPFSSDSEPDHEDLREPDELFGGFNR